MKTDTLMFNRSRSTFLSITLILVSLTGCQSYSPFNKSDQLLKVSPTQLSKYWVVKDKALDWAPLYLVEPDLQSATISFEINTEGEMVNLTIEELKDNTDLRDALLTQLSEQKFRPTSENTTMQSVLVNVTLLPN